MRCLMGLLIVHALVACVLQWQLLFGFGSIPNFFIMQEKKQVQWDYNATLRARNKLLAAEVIDLKDGLAAVEERARNDLGLVRSGEHFFFVPEVGK